jgi:hypothetical protein
MTWLGNSLRVSAIEGRHAFSRLPHSISKFIEVKPGHSGGFAGSRPLFREIWLLKSNPTFVASMRAARRSAFVARGFQYQDADHRKVSQGFERHARQ